MTGWIWDRPEQRNVLGQVLVLGFGGMTVAGGEPRFTPQVPSSWGVAALPGPLAWAPAGGHRYRQHRHHHGAAIGVGDDRSCHLHGPPAPLRVAKRSSSDQPQPSRMLAAYQKVAPRRSVNLGMRRPTQQHTGDWIAT